MNDNQERRLLSSDILAPKILSVTEANIPFGVWAKSDADYFEILLTAMKKADFDVVMISAQMERGDFEKDGILGYSNFVNEVEKSRKNNSKIAFFFKDIQFASTDVLKALSSAVVSRKIGDIRLEQTDFVFLTGLLQDNGELEHSISASIMTRMAHFIMD